MKIGKLMSVALAVAVFFAAIWAALTALRVFNTLDYARLMAAIWIGGAVSVAALTACLYSRWNRAIVSGDRSTFTRSVAWLSVMLAFDSLVVEPYLVRYLFPGIGLDGSLRWQFQLIVAGLLALAVSISQRSWRWLPFSFIATAFGVFWLVGLFSE